MEQILGAVSFISDLSVYGVEVKDCDGKAGMVALKLRDGIAPHAIDWSEFHRECSAHLPVYARPVFIRVQAGEMKMTATFKHQKNDLVKDGFDPTRMGKDSLMLYSPKEGSVTALDAEVFHDIMTGHLRL